MSGSSLAIRRSPPRPCCAEPRRSDAACPAITPKSQSFRGSRDGTAQEGLQNLAVGRKPIGPEVVAHELARGAQLLLDEGKRSLARGGVFERLEALGLGLLERLEHRRR